MTNITSFFMLFAIYLLAFSACSPSNQMPSKITGTTPTIWTGVSSAPSSID